MLGVLKSILWSAGYFFMVTLGTDSILAGDVLLVTLEMTEGTREETSEEPGYVWELLRKTYA